MDNYIYTTEDYEDTTPLPTGKYPILKELVGLATGEVVADETIDFNETVDTAWRKIAPEEQAADYAIAEKAAKAGDVETFSAVTQQIDDRTRKALEGRSKSGQEVYMKGQDLARKAMEVIAASEAYVMVNNTPEKVAAKVDELAIKSASAAELEKELEDAIKLTGWDYTKGILHEISPVGPLQGMRMQQILTSNSEFGISKRDVSLMTTRNELVNMLQLKLRSLPQEQRLEWLTNLNNKLSDTVFTNKLYLSGFISMVAGEDAAEVLGFSDWADRVGVATLPLAAFSAWARVGTRMAKATAISKQARVVAEAGGKGVLEAGDAAQLTKQLETQANIERAKAGFLAASEATGVQGVLDLSKLASVSVARVLPDAITSPASHMTKIVRTEVEGLVDNLKSILLPKTVSTVNVAEELQNLQRVYSTANNPLISNAAFRVADDGLSINGVITYKPKESTAFLSRADAELFNKTQLGGKGRVVEDTTNSGFVVNQDYVKALELERDALLAEVAEEAANVTKRTRKGKAATTDVPTAAAIAVAPAALKTSKPRFKNSEVAFDDDIDKAAYQVGSKSTKSKSDPVITEWLKGVTGWNDQQIAAHAAKVRAELNKLPEVDGSLRMRSVPKSITRAATSKEMEDVLRTPIDDDVAKAVFLDEGNFTKDGNITYSKNVPAGYVTTFIRNLGKALGMENHPVAVLQVSDIVSNAKYKSIYKLWTAMGPNTTALHIPTAYGSIILMGKNVEFFRTGKATRIQAYMDTFAHEYGHAFEYAFQSKYQGTLNTLFRDWLDAKGINFVLKGSGVNISETLPFEALMEYRSISYADIAVHEKGIGDWVAKYMGGNKEAYKAAEKDIHQWLSSYHEFFAENFSKWALTSEVPTTILGEAFAGIANGLRTIATELQNLFRKFGIDVTIAPDRSVQKFMEDHIKLVKKQKIAPDVLDGMAVSASKGIKVPTKAKIARISQIEEELEAIKAATTGVSRGFIVETDIKKFLTFGDAGKYSTEDINSAVRFAFGDFTLEASSEAVNTRLVGVHANSAYQRNLTEFIRKDVEKLNKKEMTDLNAALVRGDQEGRVFAENELAGMGLSQDTRKAYFKVRALRDVMYQVKNDAVSKVLTRKGFFDLQLNPTKLPEGIEGRLFGKAATFPENSLIYNLSDNKLTRIGESSKELVTYELARPIKVNNKYYSRVAVKPDDVTPTQITEAIPYRTGEFSRQYEDQYWVKIETVFDVDGAAKTERLTHRTAASKADADEYIKAFNDMVKLYKAGELNAQTASRMAVFGWNPKEFADQMSSGMFGADPKAMVLFNRTEDDFISNDISLGGILGGSRGDRIQNVYGDANTLNPLDSIASEISNTAYIATTLEWREAQVAKWWNTFYDDLPPYMQQMRPEEAMLDVINNKTFYAGDNHNMVVAYNTAKYMESQLNILNAEEQFYLGAARVMSEKLEGTRVPGMHHLGVVMRENSNWPQFVRTIAFHSYMGAFNIKHLFMQSMNAFNAVAISPVYGAAAAKVSTLYGLALMSDNEKIWRQVARVNKLTSLGLGMSTDEFVESVRAIRRTGLLDGIQFNSMWGAEGGKYGLFNKFTRRLGKVSAAPFNIGDGYSRLVSFDIARREYKAANPGAAWWSDDALSAILKRQDDLTQNMTQANRTSWQRGAASIPLQFTQYQVKIALNIMQSLKGNTRTFSRAEAIQLFVGHTAFLGLAGWGLMPDEWLDEATEGLPESERLSIQQGIFAWGIYHLTEGEAKLAIGSTFGTFNYYKEILDGLLDPEKTLVEALAGAGGAAAFNWMGKAGNVIGILYDRDITLDSTKDMLTELGTGFSSVNNAYKAYIAANSYNIVKSKAGKNQYMATDLELYALGVGVPPSKQYELDKLMSNEISRRKELKSLGKEIGRQMMFAAMAQNKGDTKGFEYRMNVVKGILEAHRNNMDDYNFLLKEMYKSEYSTQLQELLIQNMSKDLPPPSMMLEKPFKN